MNSWPETANLVTERDLNLDAEAPEPPFCRQCLSVGIAVDAAPNGTICSLSPARGATWMSRCATSQHGC
jgi:hypothetical protein